MATASMLWRLGRLLIASGVAEKAAERLIDRVRTIVTTRSPASAGAEHPRRPAPGDVQVQLAGQQARIEALEAGLRDQDGKLATIALTLEKFGEDVRPLLLRSTITFWMAVVALLVALVALGLVALR